MKNKFVTLLILLITLAIPTPVGHAEAMPLDRQIIQPDPQAKEIDQRTRILAAYFAKYNSPFQYHAGDFIDAADTYGVDWKLVPAISGVESTFGKHSYGYNAWGWGIYGDQRLNFSSWRRGIFTVTEGLKTKYINNGLTEPLTMNKRYASSLTWGTRVNYFMNDLDKFADDYQPGTRPPSNPFNKVAASSAQIALE